MIIFSVSFVYFALVTFKAMFNFGSTAIIVQNYCFMFESTVVVFVEHLLVIFPPIPDRRCQVLNAHLDIEVTGKMIEQRWRVESEQSEPVLITESNFEFVFCNHS